MNERIRELQSKSYLMCKQIVDDDGHVVVTPDMWFDKFAELIVKECAETLINSQYAKTFNDYYDGFNEALEYGASEIKQHFGVE